MKNNSRKTITIVALLFFGGQCIYAQNSFTNLDFESAQIVLDSASPFYPYAANVAKALPGWSFDGFRPGASDVSYDSGTAGSAAVSIHDTNTFLGLVPILQGRYSVLLQGQFSSTTPVAVSLWQTGQIPVGTQSLTFWGQLQGLQLSFGGQSIPYSMIGNGPNYTIFGANISSFAGQTGELRFTEFPNTESVIDNIQFSTQPIPEPCCFEILAFSLSLVAFPKFRKKPAVSV
jgi:hypothetical protein